MPAKHASPKKLRVPEWYVSSFMDRALDAVVRQIVKLDGVTTFHISPDIAAMARLSASIGICRNGSHFKPAGSIPIASSLHEAVEKALIDHLGLRYLHTHQIATRAEQAAVRASGLTWQAL